MNEDLRISKLTNIQESYSYINIAHPPTFINKDEKSAHKNSLFFSYTFRIFSTGCQHATLLFQALSGRKWPFK